MYENVATQKNITELKTRQMMPKWDCEIIEPVKGKLACGDVGIGKLPKPQDIVDEIHEILNDEPIWDFPFKGIKPVGITNDSYSYMHIDTDVEVELPILPHVGAYGVRRRYDMHRGVDLYVPKGVNVYAVEDGVVKDIRPWTGTKANCDWWADTDAISVEGRSGLVVYGEIMINPDLKLDDEIKAGDFIGYVVPVLKKDKGRPMSMLHLELRETGFYRNIDKTWNHNGDPTNPGVPRGSKDPTPYLLRMFKKLMK